ncbi:hypothetical protein [Lacibacter sp. H407]|uniref:hypothetical protein n=1 Tax=Lacibacter sp. H407 TaxID=3133423 RepID=UPI0030C1E237
MKLYRFYFIAVVFLLQACDKESLPKGIFKARLVDSFCSFYIVQIVDAKGNAKAMDWTNSAGIHYQNVFTVKNFCEFGAAGVTEGELFTAEIAGETEGPGCGVCMGFMETPPLQWNIKVID